MHSTHTATHGNSAKHFHDAIEWFCKRNKWPHGEPVHHVFKWSSSTENVKRYFIIACFGDDCTQPQKQQQQQCGMHANDENDNVVFYVFVCAFSLLFCAHLCSLFASLQNLFFSFILIFDFIGMRKMFVQQLWQWYVRFFFSNILRFDARWRWLLMYLFENPYTFIYKWCARIIKMKLFLSRSKWGARVRTLHAAVAWANTKCKRHLNAIYAI